MDRKYTKGLGHAIVKALRHSEALPTSSAGYAWITDVTWEVWADRRTYWGIGGRPAIAEVIFAVEASEEGRVQVVVLRPQAGPYNAVIRAIQGWSGPIADRIDVAAAFEAVGDVGVMVHFSQQAFLPTILGVNGCGLVLVDSLAAVTAGTSTSRRSCLIKMARCPISSRSVALT
jgi:RNA:NAD 2'-phosphotransferase (TPT1/KptA family)